MYQTRLYTFSSSQLARGRYLIVVGDLHGDYSSYQKILDYFDPKNDYLVLLGDYADRGDQGMAVLRGVARLLQKYPNRVIALKGNHEDFTPDGTPRFSPCTLIEEVQKTGMSWVTYFTHELHPFIQRLWLTALIPGTLFFVHGGISNKFLRINDLASPSRQDEESLLWNDPFPGKGIHPNIRGVGSVFGVDISQTFCQDLGITHIIRSHQPRKAAKKPYLEHEGRLVTINSTNIYGGNPFILCLPASHLQDAFIQLPKYVRFLK